MRLFRELRTIVPLLVLFTFILLFFMGCGGSGSSDDPPNTTNLSATSVKILDTDGNPEVDPLLMVEHPFTVEIKIASDTAVDGVAVDFFIIDKADFDDAGDKAADDDTALEDSIFFVGTTYLENLNAGLNTRQVELSLPYTTWMEQAEVVDEKEVVKTVYESWFPIPNTDYYLVGVIDPGDLIEETDEEDNRPLADNKDQTMPVVQVDNQYRDTPNLILEEILVEVPHFELKATDPVEVDSCGKEVPVEEDQLNPHVKVTAILNASGKYWPDFPDGAPMPIPRVDLRATLLTPGIDEVPDIPIQIFNNDADNPAYGPKLKIRDLEPGTPMSVSLEMRLDIPDIFLQNLVDTIATKSAACFGTCDLDEACFTKEMVSGAVCDGEDFMYCGGVIDNSDPQNPVPIIANLDWGCYMNRIDGECLDQCDPDLDCMLGCTEDLVSLEVRVEAYDDYSEEMGQPISFSAWGLIGAEIYMGVTVENCGPLSFEAHTGPWANLGTQVTAGVGTGALSAGVGGALDPLLEDTFFATVSVLDLRVEENTLRGELHEDITNTLTGPQGRVFFYVSYPCIKFCKKWGIPYPCGFKACQAKKNIVGFTTFEREDVLFCEEQPFVGSIQ